MIGGAHARDIKKQLDCDVFLRKDTKESMVTEVGMWGGGGRIMQLMGHNGESMEGNVNARGGQCP